MRGQCGGSRGQSKKFAPIHIHKSVPGPFVQAFNPGGSTTGGNDTVPGTAISVLRWSMTVLVDRCQAALQILRFFACYGLFRTITFRVWRIAMAAQKHSL
jgi:hypothetical protein